ncbi:hypothetical protein AJ78_03254 [Emergomyces pasteurianus Ep9510]|uniref:Uncharacterized protein n=1 Tax=Emergomyces pasteurianus Ep9510 TaxID=1447872 RepID=A0A1J9PKL3_9EURO|nr:hypothetical protein AJ78_03254 [Emergomyces pasteurianus Ep9510]
MREGRGEALKGQGKMWPANRQRESPTPFHARYLLGSGHTRSSQEPVAGFCSGPSAQSCQSEENRSADLTAIELNHVRDASHKKASSVRASTGKFPWAELDDLDWIEDLMIRT